MLTQLYNDHFVPWYILNDQIQISDSNYRFPYIGYTFAVQLYEEYLKRLPHNVDSFHQL